MLRPAIRTLTMLGALMALAAGAAQATVTPYVLFTDGAVLQRGMPVPVWGTATRDGETVTVSIQGKKATAVSANGQWMVRLPALRAGGPYTMTIAGDNTVTVQNVLVGEVWVCSGQSNMEFPLRAAATGPEAISSSSDRMLHLITVPKNTSDAPLSSFKGQWVESGPETTPNFTAVGYYFGRELRHRLNVPVGLIHSSWGGTYAQAWTSLETLNGTPSLKYVLDDYAKRRAEYPRLLAAYNDAVAAAQANGTEAPKRPANPSDPANPNRPCALYNAMIVPLEPYAVKGAIWYQGEANAGGAYEYQTLLPKMIESWRTGFENPNLAFFIVQLAPFMAIRPDQHESMWAELREAQRLTALHDPLDGLAVITDLGDEKDIHPKQKEPVGIRLALAALHNIYRQRVVGSGPVYESMQVEGDKIVVKFGSVGGGLVAQGGELKGFAIAGADKKFTNAKAEIKGSTVVVSCPQVPNPVAVRFGWADYPVVNLFNKEGLPASPFRTDNFPLLTQH